MDAKTTEILDNEQEIKRLYLSTPDNQFVRPYFERYLTGYELVDDAASADYAVMISTTDVYDVVEGLNFNEFAPVKENSEACRREEAFRQLSRSVALEPIILRCANIVATGMQGEVRRMADKIYKGTYLALSGNEAVISVVHAVDLPKAVAEIVNKPDIYNITDGTVTTKNQLADALAWRMGQKRIFALKPKWYRFLYGRKKLKTESTSLTFSSEKLRAVTNYEPTAVTDYLKTHVYDRESL